MWYRARVEMNMGQARVLLDGREVFEFSSPRLCGGEVGLWADCLEPARFDDVIVTTRKDFLDSFAAPLSARWRRLGGEWRPSTSSPRQVRGLGASKAGRPELASALGGARARVDAPEGGKALWGGGAYRDVEVRARVEGGSGEAGLILAYRDELNYILCSWPFSRGRARLVMVEEGKRSVVDEVESPGGPVELSASMNRGHVLCRLPGGELEGWSGRLREGRAGVWVRGAGVTLGEFHLTHHEPPPQILGTNPIFGEEREMSRWAGPASDWYPGKATSLGVPWWNRGLFPGDCELVLGVKRERGEVVLRPGARPDQGSALGTTRTEPGRARERSFDAALSVGKPGTRTGTRYNGYVLKVSSDGDSGGRAAAELHRDGEKVASANLSSRAGPLRALSLRRAGRFAVGAVNGEEVLVFRDPRPPSGSKVAWVAKGIEAEPAGAMVFSDRVRDYDFSRAPCDWRPGAGVWEVTNRWECDPRWSFYSGRPVKGKKLAVLWNKRSFAGDVSVEFYASVKMEGARGKRYSWARDLNVVICADGSDLRSGYSFLFGGFDNGRTCIVRKGQVVASTDKGVIPRTNTIHRAWFYLRVEKRGSALRFTVDNGRIASLEYEDPEPLTGARVAIWTYNCGMMVSRVKISASEGGDCEGVDVAHESPRCIYGDE